MSVRDPIDDQMVALMKESQVWSCSDPPDSLEDSLSPPIDFNGGSLSPPEGRAMSACLQNTRMETQI